MGANLLMTIILGAVFVALVLWVAVRLWTPRRRDIEEEHGVAAKPPKTIPAPEPAIAEVPTPVPEIDADALAASPVADRIEPVATPPGPPPPEPTAELEPPRPEPQVRAAAEPKPKARKKRATRAKKKPQAGPRPSQTPGVPALFHEAYRHIRTWTTSLTPGRALPAILTDPVVDRGDPTTYRFKLKQRPYAIVKTDLTEDNGGGVGPLVHEKVQLFDGEGTPLLEMALITADIGSDETPGEVTVLAEGTWLDDFRELNALSDKDSKRIGTDFRKKFRAKEQVRLKRDFGV